MVITAAGLVTPLGSGVDMCWAGVRAGATGLASGPDDGRPPWMRCVGRAEAASLPDTLPGKLLGQARFLNRGAVLGTLAALQAVGEGGLPAAIPAAERALYLATGDLGFVGYRHCYPATSAATGGRFGEVDAEVLNQVTIQRVTPFFLLESLANNPFSFLSAALGAMGPGTCLAAQSPAGANALELAYRCIRSGRASVALAIGCGSWSGEVPQMELATLGVLSSCRDGARSFRPFDGCRDGFLVGEGGAALVLERRDHAAERGVRVLGVVEGAGGAMDDHLGPRTSAGVLERAMELALTDAGVQPRELGFVCSHGSGTRQGDRVEARALATVLTGTRGSVPVCALKPLTGHMGAASDLAEVILSLRAVAAGVVPATLNLERAEPELGEVPISARALPCARRRFLSLSYGAGGQAAAVVVRVESDHRT